MYSLKEAIKYQCKLVLNKLYPELDEELIDVTASADSKFGDYQLNSAMRIGKLLHKSPKEIAHHIVNSFKEKNYNFNDSEGFGTIKIFTKIEVAGPGFINFFLADDFLSLQVKLFVLNKKFSWQGSKLVDESLSLHQQSPKENLLDGSKVLDKPTVLDESKMFGKPTVLDESKMLDKPTMLDKPKVIVDYSGPNIAKEMHVGHLRSTIIGDCLANVLEYADYEVLRINHLGDWGTQFGMLIAYLKYKNILDPNINLTDLVDYYRKAKYLFDRDASFKEKSQQEVVLLQQGSKDSLYLWEKICDISSKAYQKIYKLLNIKLIDRGESFYNQMLPEIVEDFRKKELLVESKGAQCIYLEGFVGRDEIPLPLIIKKSDGGYNYATTDLAAIKYRISKENASWLIYVTDNGQALHFAMIFAAAQKVGYTCGKDIKFNHVPLGLVLRADGKKFKTREGDNVKLQDLIDSAIIKAKELLFIKNKELPLQKLDELATILGVNAIKYADLSNNRNSDYVFDLDKMLQFNGNTAAFLSYAYVRINSIKFKLYTKFDVNDFKCNKNLHNIEHIDRIINIEGINSTFINNKLVITEIYERNLALKICKFHDVLNNVIEELLPNRLTDYLYSLAEEFHRFFHECKVIGSELQNSRLLLCEAVSKVLEQGFNLLGLKIVNIM